MKIELKREVDGLNVSFCYYQNGFPLKMWHGSKYANEAEIYFENKVKELSLRENSKETIRSIEIPNI